MLLISHDFSIYPAIQDVCSFSARHHLPFSWSWKMGWDDLSMLHQQRMKDILGSLEWLDGLSLSVLDLRFVHAFPSDVSCQRKYAIMASLVAPRH